MVCTKQIGDLKTRCAGACAPPGACTPVCKHPNRCLCLCPLARFGGSCSHAFAPVCKHHRRDPPLYASLLADSNIHTSIQRKGRLASKMQVVRRDPCLQHQLRFNTHGCPHGYITHKGRQHTVLTQGCHDLLTHWCVRRSWHGSRPKR